MSVTAEHPVGNNAPAASSPDDPMIVDPEEDAADALKTIKGYILSDLSEQDKSLINSWEKLDDYIIELCGHGLEHLSREPESLALQCTRYRSQLEDVSCGNYRALIESFECAGAVREGVSDVRTRLDKLIVALPALATATRKFSANVAVVQKERERQLRTATESSRVLEILEMPRLMRTLIAGELYDEALELRDNSVKLAAMHPNEKLIQDVCCEMNVLTQQMILQLLIVLRGAVQLPVCLRIVGFLRRLDVFSEFTLRMLFLQCRGEWMRNSMEYASAPTPQARLVHLSDSSRAMVFEIITQYRAVFGDEDEEEAETAFDGRRDPDTALASTPNGDSKPLPNFETRYGMQSSTILYDWTSSCVADYLDRLEQGLRDIRDGAALNTVLQQAMYCGQSLGRVGADFRSALAPLFDEAVLRIYRSHLNAAQRQFETMIEDHRWAPVGSSAYRRERLSSAAEGGGAVNGSAEADGEGRRDDARGKKDSESNNQYDPPLGVLDSPPLAVFLNGILAALNELRLCAPLTLGKTLGALLRDALVDSAEFMSAVGGPGGVFLKRADRPHFAAMTMSLRDLCLPHAARCLDYCLGQKNLVSVPEVTAKLNSIFGQTVASPGMEPASTSSLRGHQPELEGKFVQTATAVVGDVSDSNVVINESKDVGLELDTRHAADGSATKTNVSEQKSVQGTVTRANGSSNTEAGEVMVSAPIDADDTSPGENGLSENKTEGVYQKTETPPTTPGGAEELDKSRTGQVGSGNVLL